MNLLKFIPKKKDYTLTEEPPADGTTAARRDSEHADAHEADRTSSVQASSPKSYRLDAVGEICPFPLVEAKKAISQIAVGDYLTIDFDCTQATDSIPAWAAEHGHVVTDFQHDGDALWSITLRKGNDSAV